MHETLIIENARILDPANGVDARGDIIVEGGVFVERPSGETLEVRMDARGAWVMPGLLDLHVHFREPGGSVSETLVSGANAAARGGFTRVVTMPNTTPPMDSPELIAEHAALSELAVDILPSACCSRGREGREIADLRALRAAGAAAFTDDGAMVADDSVMERVMREAAALGVVVMDHAVVPELAGKGVIRAGAVATEHGLPIFPDAAEVEAVARDLRLCELTGCRTHIQHISCAGAVELLRKAIREGAPASGEVTPHHLMLAVEDIPGDDSNWKMNPPLGTRADIEVLRAAVLDGTACLATDHAPHAAHLKEGGFAKAMFGVLGLETAVGASLQALVVESDMDPLAWVAAWTTAPARIIDIPAPSLSYGNRADLCLARPESWTVEETDLVSLSKNSPFLGRRLFGKVELTIKAGKITYGRAID